MRTYEQLKLTYETRIQLTETEQKILAILISHKVGSAYSIQRNSQLKHYSTVLRALKKLEEKGCIEAKTEISGARGKRVYSPTMIGKVANYISKNEKKQIIELFKQNSNRFRAMVDAEVENIDDWVYDIATGLIWNLRANELERSKLKNINEILLDFVYDFFMERLLELDEENIQEIKEISKIKWIRQYGIKLMSEYSDWQMEQSQMSKKLIAELRKFED